MKKNILFFAIVILLFIFGSKAAVAAWTPNLTPVTFYTATRPTQPMAWYPNPDPECIFPPVCLNLFYAPSIILEGGKYKMWTTVDDMIFYAESTDGKTWTNGRMVLVRQKGTWEDSDGNPIPEYVGGLSNPVVVKGVTSGWAYTMYYTAGPMINTTAKGGLGVAFSNDGINWTRYGGNPIRKFVGGGTYAANAMKIGNTRYIYYYGGGASNDRVNPTEAPNLIRAKDLGNGLPASQNDTNHPDEYANFSGSQTNKTAYPIASDPQTNTCLMYNRGVTSADFSMEAGGVIKFQVYKGSDCLHNLGTQIAEITPQITGDPSNGNAGASIKERDGNGQILLGADSLQLIFSSGITWAGWYPRSVTLSRFASDPPIGILSEANCQTVSGWALDENSPGLPIDIHFYYDVLDANHFLGATKASLEWPGICTYHDLPMPPCLDTHKYIFNISAKIKDGKPHQVYAFGINLPGTPGQNAPLTESPKTITCQTTGTNIYNLRQLLAAFTDIFAYNQLAGNFGK